MEAAQLRSVLISLRLNLSPAMLRRGPRHSAAPRRPPPLRCQSPLQAGAGDAGKLAETLSLDTDDAEHWSDEEKEAFTAAAIEGFLQSAAPHRKRRRRHYNERHSNQHSGSTSGAKTSEHGINSGRSADGGGRYPPTEPGLQSKVVGHLLAGDFCEELLSSTPPQTLNWAVKTLGVNSRPDLAEQLFHWMRVRCIANEHSLVKLFEAFEACRQAPVKSLQTWRNVRRMHCPFVPGARSAAALLKVYRAAGDVSGALRTLSELQSRGTQLNQYAYNVAIRACADVGDAEAAFQVFEQLREHSSAHADIRTFSALMDAVAKSGRWSRTTLVHRLLIEDGLTPDATLYLQILAGYAGAARPDAAEAVFDRMQDGERLRQPQCSELL